MKTKFLFPICVLFLLCYSNFSTAQRVLVGEKMLHTRAISAYVIPNLDTQVEELVSSSESCIVKLDNWTGLYIDVWVDKIYKGRLNPWSESQVIVGTKWTEIYCKTMGQTYEWSAEGDCQEEFQLKLETEEPEE
jgi:hypothetical protein